jgi:flagellar biosynthesis protein FlhF
MRVKRFEGETIQQALLGVRQEMGPDAVILHTRKFKKGGFLGLFGRERAVILAATDIRVPEDLEELRVTPRAAPVEQPPEVSRAPQDRLAGLEQEVAALRESIEKLIETKTITTADDTEDRPTPMRKMLIDSDVDVKLAAKFESLASVEEKGENGAAPADEDALLSVIAAAIPTSGEIEPAEGGPKVVALIGPTGVGKTTTIAKLAANHSLHKGHRVGLLTVDTYRIAAVDQLRSYADIIDIPLKVAHDAKEAAARLEEFSDCDLVFVDTAGRSQKNEMQLGELKACLSAIEPEVHLVVSATTREKELFDMIDRFSAIRADRLIITKLDETCSFGFLLNLLDRYPIPVSYITDGQKVPDDIEPAEAVRLAKLVLASSDPAYRADKATKREA